ncbi:MAG: SLC13 family permease [Candidatus Parvarchaeota archaeon]|nr:SLC13 family permease [Candidatus Rehaiarchaeum fermentans]
MNIKRIMLNELFFFVFLFVYIALVIYNPRFLNSKLVDWNAVSIIASLIIANTGIFVSGGTDVLARRIVYRFKDERSLSMAAILLTLLLSMFITNDASLIVLVPLTLSIGKLSGNNMSKTVILEAIAANVGSTLTPFGNPQNIIIFKYYRLSLVEFLKASTLVFLLMLFTLIFLSYFLLKRKAVKPRAIKVTYKPTLFMLSFALFIVDIVGFFLGLNYKFFVATSLVGIIFLLMFRPSSYTKRDALLRIDFFLILTFIMIFLVVNSLKSLILFSISGTLLGLISAALLSQLISNVPVTVLLAGKVSFLPLLWGVNIGGNGTIIASLANLIAYRKLNGSLLEFLKISSFFLAITLLLGILVLL